MKLLVCSFALFTAVRAASISWEDRPPFCKDHDCPKYTVIDSNDKYEVRQYEKSYWVRTTMRAIDYWNTRLDSYKAFYRLFGYISGKNTDSVKMDMTAPVVKYHTKDGVAMAFMLPYKYYGKAPQPTDKDVQLFTSNPYTVYVKVLKGKADQEVLYTNSLEELKQDLKNDGVTLTTDTFYTAGYDGPSVRPSDRYREVWIAKP